MSVKIAVIGKTGQLAQALAQRAAETDFDVVFYDRADCDLSASSETITQFMEAIPRPDIVILAAAYTNVDGAEDERDLAFAVNARAPEAIAKFCAALDIPLVHISTDCVFDGTKKIPYMPEDKTNPINVYGASKLAGERALLSSGARVCILRTSWVYGAMAHNFMAIMLGLAPVKPEIKVVADQIGLPTNVLHFAGAVFTVAKGMHEHQPDSAGIFHICGSGAPISRYAFAQAIFLKAYRHWPYRVIVTPIASHEFASKAQRPLYCALDNRKYERVFGCALPKWDDGLEQACIIWCKNKNAQQAR